MCFITVLVSFLKTFNLLDLGFGVFMFFCLLVQNFMDSPSESVFEPNQAPIQVNERGYSLKYPYMVHLRECILYHDNQKMVKILDKCRQRPLPGTILALLSKAHPLYNETPEYKGLFSHNAVTQAINASPRARNEYHRLTLDIQNDLCQLQGLPYSINGSIIGYPFATATVRHLYYSLGKRLLTVTSPHEEGLCGWEAFFPLYTAMLHVVKAAGSERVGDLPRFFAEQASNNIRKENNTFYPDGTIERPCNYNIFCDGRLTFNLSDKFVRPWVHCSSRQTLFSERLHDLIVIRLVYHPNNPFFGDLLQVPIRSSNLGNLIKQTNFLEQNARDFALYFHSIVRGPFNEINYMDEGGCALWDRGEKTFFFSASSPPVDGSFWVFAQVNEKNYGFRISNFGRDNESFTPVVATRMTYHTYINPAQPNMGVQIVPYGSADFSNEIESRRWVFFRREGIF